MSVGMFEVEDVDSEGDQNMPDAKSEEEAADEEDEMDETIVSKKSVKSTAKSSKKPTPASSKASKSSKAAPRDTPIGLQKPRKVKEDSK